MLHRAYCTLLTAAHTSSLAQSARHVRRIRDGRRVVSRRGGGGGEVAPGWRATTAAWRRGWNLLQPGSATRATSTLTYSKPSPSSHGSAMVELKEGALSPKISVRPKVASIVSIAQITSWLENCSQMKVMPFGHCLLPHENNRLYFLCCKIGRIRHFTDAYQRTIKGGLPCILSGTRLTVVICPAVPDSE